MPDKKIIVLWLAGLERAVLYGFGGSQIVNLLSPGASTKTQVMTAIGIGLTGIINYLIQSPLPGVSASDVEVKNVSAPSSAGTPSV